MDWSQFDYAFLVLVAALGFGMYCLADIAQNDVRYLSKWAWAVIVIISIPIGGIVYLFVGREPRR